MAASGINVNQLTLLVSGSVLATVTTTITEKGFALPSAQLLPYAKYLTINVYTALERQTHSTSRRKVSRRGSLLVYLIGCLSVIAYCCYCVGMSLAGTGLALGLHAATSQTFTAILSRVLLKRRLSTMQILAVVIVNVGMLLRSFAPPSGKSGSGQQHPSDQHAQHWLGGAAIIASSLCYALLGVVFDYLLKTEKPTPSYAQIMEVEGWIGTSALTVWQLFFTLPNWDAQIASPFKRSGSSFLSAAGLLAASGVTFIWHYFNLSALFKTDGAVAVGLVNAVRGAIVTLLAGWMYCSSQRPSQCNSFWTVTSALVVTMGAALWVVGPPAPEAAQTAEQRDSGSKAVQAGKKAD